MRFGKFLAALSVAAVIFLCRPASAASARTAPAAPSPSVSNPSLPAVDTDEGGPGVIFYEEYNEQPWRLRESPSRLLESSLCLSIASGAVFIFIRYRAKKHKA